MTVYLVNYGMDRQHYLSTDKRFTNKRKAIHEAVNAVRELGAQAWASVCIEDEDVKGEQDVLLAHWDQSIANDRALAGQMSIVDGFRCTTCGASWLRDTLPEPESEAMICDFCAVPHLQAEDREGLHRHVMARTMERIKRGVYPNVPEVLLAQELRLIQNGFWECRMREGED